MSFAYPWVLFLMLVPAVLLVATWRRRGGELVLPYDHGGPRRGRTLAFFVRLADSLPALILAVAVLICAGPQRLDAPKSRRKLTNIEFCLDVSGSMTAKFGEGSRYDAAMASINEFLDYRTGDAFGLTFFGGSVLHWVPLTADASAFRCAPPFMDPKKPGRPGWFNSTEIGRALRSCRKVLMQREAGDRMIILISDGISYDLQNGTDEEIARELREQGIVLYAIHIGGGEVPGEVANVAGLSGGAVFEGGDPAGLDAIFRRIDKMQKAEMEKMAADRIDDFELFALIGASLLGAYLLTQLGLRYTPW